MEKKLNAVEYAVKVTSFRNMIRGVCRKKGLEYPADEKIAEYIEQGYGFDLDAFMADYTEKEGIFRDPITDFVKKVKDLNWADTPSEDMIRGYAANHPCDVDEFVKWYNIETITNPMEKATLIETLKLANRPRILVSLWNEFINESAKYGEDSYIYDLRNNTDRNFINVNFPKDVKAELTRLINEYKIHGKELRFFQWFSNTLGKTTPKDDLHIKEDIKAIIIAYWGEIFERILLFPDLYLTLEDDTLYYDYFEKNFFPAFLKASGWELNYNDCTAKLK